MRNLLTIIVFLAFSIKGQAQTKPDSVKNARDYIIENENKRSVPPNIVKPDPKKLKPLQNTGEVTVTPATKNKKCCWFCKRKK